MQLFTHPQGPVEQAGNQQMPVQLHEDEHGTWVCSFWKPDATELAVLRTGGVVQIRLLTTLETHPITVVGVSHADE